MLEGTNYEGKIHLLMNTKFKMIVVDTNLPIINNPHYMSLFFCENIVIDYQLKTEAVTDHYL